MISKRISTSCHLAFCLIGALTIHAVELSELRCAKSLTFLAPIDSADHRKYAPSREIDILHLTIDVTPDFKQRTVSGKTTIKFKPIAKPLDELRLDAVDLTVSSITATDTVQSFQVTDRKVIVTFADPIPPDREASVTIAHSAEPAKGLYFRTPEMGYKEGETHLFTQGEAIEARHWYPCFDSPNEKFTSEVIGRVPEGMVVLSNGRLVSEEKDPATGLKAVRWLQDKPHVNYLISLVAGYFKKIEDKYKDIPLAFHVPPSQIDQAVNSFRNTKDMMAYFESEIGVAYPWAKYDQVCVNDFVAGGMENTSITTLTHHTLFTSATENIRTSDGLVAHELAHQWFGDLVTCKDWSHLWLNEGFATYYAHLYDGQKNGRDSMRYGLYHSAKGFIDRTDDTKPMVYRQYDSPNEQFSYLAYPKGAWVLHMLRSQLGGDLYRRCIKAFLERHQYGTVVTEDLNQVIEELSGRSFDQFFDQWVYHAHHPELDVNYRWNAKTKLAKVSIAQTQKLSADVLLFNFPLTVQFKFGATPGRRKSDSTGGTPLPALPRREGRGMEGEGSPSQSVNRRSNTGRNPADAVIRHQITVKEKAEDFYFALPEAPEIVRLDPDYTLLAKIKFNVPDAMLHAQLADTNDVAGRLFAIEQLSGKKDHTLVAKLKETLQSDPFYGVRIEAARALRAIHSEEAFSALVDSRDQPDARVRHQVVVALAGFYNEEALASAQRVLSQEQNPEILEAAIRGLAAYAKPDVKQTLLRYLNSDSYRNELAETAVAAIRAQADAEYAVPLLDAIKRRQSAFTSFGLGRALDTLAYLARQEKAKDEIREFIAPFTRSQKRTVQQAAITALGSLEDPKAIPLLETFAGAGKESPVRSAAERAISVLRAGKKPGDDLRDLRNEVLELQKQNRDFRKEFDDLKKKNEAGSKPAAATKASPKAKPGKASKR